MQSLLNRIRESGIFLRLDEQDQLKIVVKKDAPSNGLIEEIRQRKAEIVEYLIQQKNDETFDKIRKSEKQPHYRLSSSQFRIWILSQFEGGSIAFNIPESIRLEGIVNVELFKKAIRRTIERHEILHTVFKEDEKGEVRQWVVPMDEFELAISVIGLDGVANETGYIDQYIDKDKLIPFDLSKGPLIRGCLFKMNNGCTHFYYNIHHIISDGWSANLLKKNIMLFYAALTSGADMPFTALPFQYKDYSEWQASWSESREMGSHKNYWAGRLNGVPLINLPAAKIRPPVKTYNGFTCSFSLGKDLTRQLKNKYRQDGGTLFMGLLANLKLLIYKYTGQVDITIGSPVSGRLIQGLEEQMGCYINMVALRTLFSENDTCSQLFSAVQKTVFDAFKHQALPFEKVLEVLNIHRDISRTPVFDIIIILQDMTASANGRPAPDLPGNKEVREVGSCPAKYDITFEFHEHPDTIEGFVEFNTDIYDNGFILQLTGDLIKMLEASIDQADVQVKYLDFLGPAETNRLTFGLNDTRTIYPQDKTVMDLFNMVAGERNREIAIRFKDHQMTYGQLDELSGKFCHYLQTEGVLPGDIVVISLPKSQWLIVALLGVFKAGAIYLPLDLSFPKERVEYIKMDSHYKMLIDEAILGVFINTAGSMSASRPDRNVAPHQIAYVIYTSGSTGQPKGVEITHRSLTNFLVSMQHQPGMKAGDKLLSVTTPSFDISMLEFLLPLLCGAQLCIYPQSTVVDPHMLLKTMEDIRPTIMQGTPSFWNFLFESGWKGDTKLKVLCGGEEMNYPLGQRLRRHSAELWNMYGPTETTIWSTINRIASDTDIKSIGRPINNTMILILDNNLNLLPFGAIGEICIGGDGLSPGYRNKPGLTKERYITPPFDKNLRLYKTGDSGRWLPDGTLQCLGRLDYQVKIRGHRIELAEIDNVILNFEGVRQAVTIVAPGSVDKELIAYFAGEETLDIPGLKSRLQAFLPAYMLPNHLVRLDALPLTPNGKIDRNSLPPVQYQETVLGCNTPEPLNDREAALVNLCKKVLNKNEISIKDNFFQLGGDSIKAVMVVNQLKLQGHHLEIADLIRYSDLEELSSKIVPLHPNPNSFSSDLVSARQYFHSGEIIPLSFNQRIYVREEKVIDAFGVFGFTLADFNQDKFIRTYRKLLEYCNLLRIKLVKTDNEFVQQIMGLHEIPENIVFRQCDFKKSRRHLVEYIGQLGEGHLDPFLGRNMQVAVFYKNKEAFVYITIHHIITNFRSNLLLKNLFLVLYNDGELPPMTSGYIDFIFAQRRFLSSREGLLQKNFWQDKFSDLAILKTYSPRRTDSEPAIGFIRNFQVIDGSLYDSVKQYSAERKILFNILMLAIIVKFSTETKRIKKDLFLAITVDGSSLNIPGLDHSAMLGQFVNILPFYIEIGQDTSFEELAYLLQDAYLEGLLYQQVPITEIDAGFKDRHGVSFHQVNNIACNFMDFSNDADKEWRQKGPYKEKTEESTIPWMRQHVDEIILKVSKFSDEIHLEWELSCPKKDIRRMTSQCYFPDKLKEILEKNI